MKELGNVIIISISSFKIYEDMNKFSLQRMSNKGKSFPLQGEFFLAIVSLALEGRFSGASGGTECKLRRIAPQLRAPLWLCHGILGVPQARSSELAWSETLSVLSCIWWCSASVEETAELSSAPGCEVLLNQLSEELL